MKDRTYACPLRTWLDENAITCADGMVDRDILTAVLVAQLGPAVAAERHASTSLRTAVMEALAMHGTVDHFTGWPEHDPGSPEWSRDVGRTITDEGRERIRRASADHAFELVVVAALVRDARKRGGLPTSSLRGLMDLDRPLWNALDVDPLASSHRLSGLGLMSHMTIEVQVGHPIATPQVSQAAAAVLRLVESRIHKR